MMDRVPYDKETDDVLEMFDVMEDVIDMFLEIGDEDSLYKEITNVTPIGVVDGIDTLIITLGETELMINVKDGYLAFQLEKK